MHLPLAPIEPRGRQPNQLAIVREYGRSVRAARQRNADWFAADPNTSRKILEVVHPERSCVMAGRAQQNKLRRTAFDLV